MLFISWKPQWRMTGRDKVKATKREKEQSWIQHRKVGTFTLVIRQDEAKPSGQLKLSASAQHTARTAFIRTATELTIAADGLRYQHYGIYFGVYILDIQEVTEFLQLHLHSWLTRIYENCLSCTLSFQKAQNPLSKYIMPACMCVIFQMLWKSDNGQCAIRR